MVSPALDGYEGLSPLLCTLDALAVEETNTLILPSQAIALEYVRHGANVAISHLGGPKEDDQLEALRKEINEIEEGAAKTRFITVAGDISQPETGKDFVAKTVEAFGRLDVFVSNAGVCQFADFLEYV